MGKIEKQNTDIAARAKMLVDLTNSTGLPLDDDGDQNLAKAIAAERLKRLDSSEVLFQLLGPNGQKWQIHMDGTIQGFPEGTIVANFALPLMQALLGKVDG